ncbi:Hsd17b14 [Phodopus roborovskii]|uniref:Hsd17b14 protein n=1 Tax=Phodopus roborovskii TaxID=109678 RepID=A0AAU9YKI2_PHORO|nr:Hsd17b14 [Phodopus roborovskii]
MKIKEAGLWRLKEARKVRVWETVNGYSRKVVVVTQGGRGMRAGVVKAFKDSGAFCDKDEVRGPALEQELLGTVFFPCDVTQEGDLQAMISETLSQFGHLDCVVKNAGYHPPAQWPEETSAQDFRYAEATSSTSGGTIGQSQAVTYMTTKGAVTAMTKSAALALDESQYGVLVNCISPGNIWTPLWEEPATSTSDPSATILEGSLAHPLGHMGQPAEVEAAAVFLASEATFCTGLELLATGGAELEYGCKASRSSLVEAPILPP